MAKAIRVVVLDDDEMFLRVVCKRLVSMGFDVVTSTDAQEAIGLASQRKVEVALLDIHMPGINGFEVLKQIKANAPEVQVIMMTGFADMESVLTAMRLGAYDYLPKPFARFDEVCETIKRSLARPDDDDDDSNPLDVRALVGSSKAMQAVHDMIAKVASSDAPVLIVGESGTGKELIAREIHRLSKRAKRPWVPVNCAALPDNLLESELFGYVKGAFTGALYDKRGLLLAAHQGTLFLDEIGDLAAATQTKLLRVLQEREVRPLGATREVHVDFRLICATNVDLEQRVADKSFREDLYYRINVVKIEVPPLRKRGDDIPELAQHFLKKFCKSENKPLKTLTPAAEAALCGMAFKGNVRELQNVIFRAVVLSESDSIGPDLISGERVVAAGDLTFSDDEELFTLPFSEAKKVAAQSFERHYIESALTRSEGKIAAAARIAKLDRSNFKRIAKRHQIKADDFSQNTGGPGN